MVSFKKNLEPSHGVLQLLKKNFYTVLLLHLLRPLFSVFHGLQALSIFFFVLVNDLYIGDPLEANKRQEIYITPDPFLQLANGTGPNRTRAQWKFTNVYHQR